MKTMKLKFYSDPGHGWLAVPMATYLASGVQATNYSYVNDARKVVYLEEDCDATNFVNALKLQGVEIETDYRATNKRSRVRRMDSVSVLKTNS